MNKTLIIKRTDDGKVSLSANPSELTFSEVLELTLTALAGTTQHLIKQTPSSHKKQAEEALYDAINLAASNLLNTLFPEIEMRPNLTVEAIKKAENELINEAIPD